MHLREACIDLDGQISAEGRFVYPADDAGHFVPSSHQRVRIRMYGKTLRLAEANAERDPVSKFLVSSETGPTMFLPATFSNLMLHALKFQPEGPLEARIVHQEGTFESIGNREIALVQPLSDWKLHIVAVDNTIKFTVSAALTSTRPIPEWQQKRTGNFWVAACSSHSRLAVEFSIDATTRTAAYGFWPSGISDQIDTVSIDPRHSTLSDVMLEQAPIGIAGEQFVIMKNEAGDGWASVSRSDHSLSISPEGTLKRHPNGFVVRHANEQRWPRIRLSGIDMDRIVDYVRDAAKTLTLKFDGGFFGSLDQHHSFYECYDILPRQNIRTAELNARLDLFGLHLAYRLYVEDLYPAVRGPHSSGWLQNEITFPWELLILRYPVLINDRARLLQRA
jgi:hypothetical protein